MIRLRWAYVWCNVRENFVFLKFLKFQRSGIKVNQSRAVFMNERMIACEIKR